MLSQPDKGREGEISKVEKTKAPEGEPILDTRRQNFTAEAEATLRLPHP